MPVTHVPASIEAFWSEFEGAAGPQAPGRFLEAFHFDDNEASANHLAGLVLAGRKRATAGSAWLYESTGKRAPAAGDLSVVTTWAGDPVCVIETKDVSVVPFDQVSAEFAATEGEGDCSLDYWRRVHWDYLQRECAGIGREPAVDMPVLCERFDVVYTRPRGRDVCGGTLTLRKMAGSDTPVIFSLSQEAGMKQWLPDQVYADEAEALQVVEYLASQYESPGDPRRGPYVMAVCIADSGEVVGHVGFSPCSDGVEIGYAIGDGHQNRGYATRAVSLGAAWALAAFGLPEVVAVVAEDNLASCKVLDASGFHLVGSHRRKLHGVERMTRTYRFPCAAGQTVSR